MSSVTVRASMSSAPSSSSSPSSMVCYNSECTRLKPEQPRTGWRLRNGELTKLCDRCASAYEEGRFCETFHLKASGWRCCVYCGKRVHCGCIVSSNAFTLLDPGGIECIACSRKTVILTSNPAWTPSLFSHSPLPERLEDLSVKNWSQLAGSGSVPWQQAPSFFGSIPPSEMHSGVPYEISISTANNKLSAGDRIAVSYLEKRKIEDFSERLQNRSLKLGARDILNNGTADARGRDQLLPDQELQQISEAVDTTHAEPQQKRPCKEVSTSRPRCKEISLDVGEDISFRKDDEATKKQASQMVLTQNADILKDYSHSQLSHDAHQLLVLVLQNHSDTIQEIRQRLKDQEESVALHASKAEVLQNQAVMAQKHSDAVQEILERVKDKKSLEKRVSELEKACKEASGLASKAEVMQNQAMIAQNHADAVQEILKRLKDKEYLEKKVSELEKAYKEASDRASNAEVLQNQAMMAQNHSDAVHEILKRLKDKESLEKKVSELEKAHKEVSDRASNAEVLQNQAAMAQNYSDAVQEILKDKEYLEKKVSELEKAHKEASDCASKAEVLQNQAVMAQKHSDAVQEILERTKDIESLKKRVPELEKDCKEACDREVELAKTREELASAETRLHSSSSVRELELTAEVDQLKTKLAISEKNCAPNFESWLNAARLSVNLRDASTMSKASSARELDLGYTS